MLTPNLKGFDAAGATEVAVFASAFEGFSQRNINCSIDESLRRFEPVLEAAKQRHVSWRPYDGPTAPERVADVTARLWEFGSYVGWAESAKPNGFSVRMHSSGRGDVWKKNWPPVALRPL